MNFDIKNECDASPSGSDDWDSENQSSNNSGEPYVKKIDMGAMKVMETMDGDPEVNIVMGMGQVMKKVTETQVMAQAMQTKIEQTEFLLVKQRIF